MSSESKTVVPGGITDPVERARAELKAALAAIEHKTNAPARIAEAVGRKADRARAFARKEPVAGAVVAAGVAVSVGTAVWGFARLLARK